MYRKTSLCPSCSAFCSATCTAYKYRRPGSTPKNNGVHPQHVPFVEETALLWHTSLLNSHRGFIVGMAVAYMPDLRLSRNTSTTQASDAWSLQFWGQMAKWDVRLLAWKCVESLRMVLSRAIGGSWLQVNRHQGSMTRHNFAHLMCNKVSPRRPGTSLYMQHSHQVYYTDTCSSDRL